MKTGRVGGVIVLLCLLQFGAMADSDRSADHQALRALRDKVETALNAGNIQNVRTCLASDFTFITSDQTVLTNWTATAAYWEGMFKSAKSPVKAMATKVTADVLTQFVGPDLGYCHGTSRDVYTLRNDRKIALTNTWSAMLVKEQGEWKIRTVHVAVNFLSGAEQK
jgi:ketosteroid isomerase-like protein